MDGIFFDRELRNFVIFKGYRKPSNYNVTLLMDKKVIEQKSYIKYLGILIDEHLRYGGRKFSKKIGKNDFLPIYVIFYALSSCFA